MTRYSGHTILVIMVLTFSSCATMFNAKNTSLTIITSEPTNMVYHNDTIKGLRTSRLISVYRDKEPLIVEVYNDSLKKTVSIKSKNSFAYWLNLYPNFHLWTGFYFDTKTKKRYTYPKTVYIDLRAKDTSFLTYKPLKKTYDSFSNIIKITPSKILGIISPSIELSYERRTSRSFSTQLMAAYLFPVSFRDMGNDFKPDIKGFRVAVEEKYYFRKSAPIGPYTSLEFSYLNTQYKDIGRFGVANTFDTTYYFTNYLDTFGIKKQTYSTNLKLGYQIIVNRFSFDFYAGLGLRYKDVRHFDRIKPKDEMELPRHPNAYYYSNHEGQYWTVSIPLNVSIGWTF